MVLIPSIEEICSVLRGPSEQEEARLNLQWEHTDGFHGSALPGIYGELQNQNQDNLGEALTQGWSPASHRYLALFICCDNDGFVELFEHLRGMLSEQIPLEIYDGLMKMVCKNYRSDIGRHILLLEPNVNNLHSVPKKRDSLKYTPS